MNTFVIAAATLALASTSAFASASRGVDFPTSPAGARVTIVGNPISLNVGSHRQAEFVTSVSAPVVQGVLVPTTGANGPVQTANSLASQPEIQGAWANPGVYAAARGDAPSPSGLALAAQPGSAS